MRDTDHPLLWKEVYFGASKSSAQPFIDFLVVVFCGFVFIEGVLILSQLTKPSMNSVFTYTQEYVTPAIRVVSVILGIVLCIAVGFRAAGSFARERDEKTLQSLLLIPEEWTEILAAKWMGSIWRMRRLIYCLLVLWGLGVLTTALHPLSAILLVLSFGVVIALVASMGVWLSLACRNTMSANFTMALTLMLLFLGAWLVLTYTQTGPATPNQIRWFTRFLEIGVNPLAAWWFAGQSFTEVNEAIWNGELDFAVNLSAFAAGLVVFELLALLMWHAARQRLDGIKGARPRPMPALISQGPASLAANAGTHSR